MQTPTIATMSVNSPQLSPFYPTRSTANTVKAVETAETPATWMSLDSALLSEAYSPSSHAPNFLQILDSYQARSDAARQALGPGEVMVYGPAEREFIRLYEATNASPPLLVFFHGGYWQEGSADMSLFPALELPGSGISFAAVGYTLAPESTVSTIVDQCAQALAKLAHAYFQRHSGARIVLSGSSAGAHLAAMMMTVNWQAHGFATTPFSSAVLLSGVYDLRPLVSTYINDALKMSAALALRNSPLFCELPAAVPCTICWGENETAEFRQQSERFGRRLGAAGIDTRLFEVADRNHFDIVFDLSRPNTTVGRDVRARLKD